MDKIIRLEIIQERHNKSNSLSQYEKPTSLIDLFGDIMFIEADILMSRDVNLYKKLLRLFADNTKTFGLDYEADYDAQLFLIDKLGFR